MCALLSSAARIVYFVPHVSYTSISCLKSSSRTAHVRLMFPTAGQGERRRWVRGCLCVCQATYNLVPRVFLFKTREDLGARLRLPRVNKRTDVKRGNNKHVHHKIFMEIKVSLCYLQFYIMQILYVFTFPPPPPSFLNKHHLMPLKYTKSYLPMLSFNL